MKARNSNRGGTEIQIMPAAIPSPAEEIAEVEMNATDRSVLRKKFKSAWKSPLVGASFESKRLMRTIHRHAR
jgi:hypothetical protein